LPGVSPRPPTDTGSEFLGPISNLEFSGLATALLLTAEVEVGTFGLSSIFWIFSVRVIISERDLGLAAGGWGRGASGSGAAISKGAMSSANSIDPVPRLRSSA
jgi:hypothetical protein